MKHYDAAAVAAALDDSALIEALRATFQRETLAPPRQHHVLDQARTQTLLMMPAWDGTDAIGVKLVTVFAGNPARGLAAVNALYVLFDAHTGAVRATLDGTELTLRRTSAASALASQLLSRPDSQRLLMVGTGALAPHLIRAHCRVRPIRSVAIWGRNPEHAQRLTRELRGLVSGPEPHADHEAPAPPQRGAIPEAHVPELHAVADLREAVAQADIISCATLAQEPLIHGEWLIPGQHLDLVGAFNERMRETDDAALVRAQVFVDTRDGARADAGEIIHALASGAISPAQLLADLHELTRGLHPGRRDGTQITLFKSVGHALEDLAAAQLVLAREAASRPRP
ncbi:MAG: ornithine cyclodeaminase family protein [Proteobacteria bacterium]|nr:ornithine cyclodeaminase family protein [Pseudomonadota bacterium]